MVAPSDLTIDPDPDAEFEPLSGNQDGSVRDVLLPRPSASISTPEPRATHPAILFFCVILPAFFGLLYYFIYRPHKLTIRSRANIPHTAVAPTLLISIDGFRHEYLVRSRNGKPLAPNLQKLAIQGVVAHHGMQPVMPTKTWPNHWSLVTGLYAESHGIVGNTMYDPASQQWFHHTGTHPRWWHGEPIWRTLQRTPLVAIDAKNISTTSDHNYTTACVFWPGSNVENLRPDAFWEYDKSASYEKRLQRGIDLLFGYAKDLGRAAQFVTLYFEGVDHSAHENGPDSPSVDREIVRVDHAIGELLRGLGDEQKFNIIVLSDHGMTEVSEDRRVDLSPAIKPGTVQDIRITPLGVWLNITVPSEKVHEEIQRELMKHGDNATVYLKENIPERWHIRNSPFITDVVTMAKLGWTVVYPHQKLVVGAERRLPRDLIVTAKGNHGFDNREKDMQALFVAHGPAFRSGANVEGLQAVDIYPMLCHIFGATPAPHNGTLEKTLSSILKT